jgi:hypothetical protein
MDCCSAPCSRPLSPHLALNWLSSLPCIHATPTPPSFFLWPVMFTLCHWGIQNSFVHIHPGADARCLNAPDNPPAFLLAAACDGSEMLELVDQCVCRHNVFVHKRCDFGCRYLRRTVATKSPSAKLSDRSNVALFGRILFSQLDSDSGQRLS